MLKSTLTALVAVAAFAPAAFAEGSKHVTLTHDYDAAVLASEDGASALVSDLTRSAKRLCTTRLPAGAGVYTDKACVDSLVSAAVKQIFAQQSEAGMDIAPGFERIALTRMASAE
jgi:UrcA family protein